MDWRSRPLPRAWRHFAETCTIRLLRTYGTSRFQLTQKQKTDNEQEATMMKDLVLKNRSYRRFYEDVEVDSQTLRELVDLARLSASASNKRPLPGLLTSRIGTDRLLESALQHISSCLQTRRFLRISTGTPASAHRAFSLERQNEVLVAVSLLQSTSPVSNRRSISPTHMKSCSL